MVSPETADFSLFPHMAERDKLALWVFCFCFLMRALIPIMRLHPQDLNISQWPPPLNNIIWRIRISTYEFRWGTSIHTIAKVNSILISRSMHNFLGLFFFNSKKNKALMKCIFKCDVLVAWQAHSSLLFLKYILMIMLLQLSHFFIPIFPFCHESATLQHSYRLCSCPWVMHILSLHLHFLYCS